MAPMTDDYFTYYVYILASKPGGTLYVGITNDIIRRTREHQNDANPDSFTSKYKVKQLVYVEKFDNVMNAIHYEKRLKKWRRGWKFLLIADHNSHWHDLSKNWQHVS